MYVSQLLTGFLDPRMETMHGNLQDDNPDRSPDASRFLAQSQSRISNFGRPENGNNIEQSRYPYDRRRQQGPPASRSFFPRGPSGNPYLSGASQVNYPFAGRGSQAAAPLFHSATDDVRDDEEREREASDQLALQESRRLFTNRRLHESSEAEADDLSRASLQEEDDSVREAESRSLHGHGIDSSWRGDRRGKKGRRKAPEAVQEEFDAVHTDTKGTSSSNNASRLFEVGLESAMMDDPPDDIAFETPRDDHPPAFQKFRTSSDRSTENESLNSQHREQAEAPVYNDDISDTEAGQEAPIYAPIEWVRHDPFWGSLYLILLASLFATFILVWLHTSTPSRKHPLGDTVYSTLSSSTHLLAVDTVVAVIVSLVWLAALRSFVKPLVFSILLGVPVILFSFTLYPFISSYKGSWNGQSLQDKVMRWAALGPATAAIVWAYTVYRGRRSIAKAISILEFSSRVLAANPALLLVGFGTLAGVTLWTWIWMGMFTRVFLGGHLTSNNTFIIDTSSWWLGVWFILMYLWTLSVGSGIQRATTAATVSQWYFHRNTKPSPGSRQVVQAALGHAATSLFGTICLSTLLSLMVRLPFLILPRRLIGLTGVFFYSFVPTSFATLTNPLTLTYAAVHSQPLVSSARSLSMMNFLTPSSPTTTLNPQAFSGGRDTPLLPYRLAKLLLHATRFVTSLALGFGGWVSTARMLEVQGAGFKGSLYAYVVGLIAGAIGWGILGAMEGVLGGVVDGIVVCWGSEGRGRGDGGYCLEARYLFSDEPR